jgi:hypothetical protein
MGEGILGLVRGVEESPVNLVGLEMIEKREGKSAGAARQMEKNWVGGEDGGLVVGEDFRGFRDGGCWRPLWRF